MWFSRGVSVVSVCLCTFCLVSATYAQGPQELRVSVAEGEGAIYNITERTARAPVVLVEDEAGRPIAGAFVTFVLPAVGPGGAFEEGNALVTSRTGFDGRATPRGFRPNSQVGSYQMRVTVSHEGKTVTAAIPLTNAAPIRAGSGSKKILILGLVAGAVAGGVVAATSRGKTAAPGGVTPPATTPGGTVITPGTPGFGPPQ